MLSGRIQHKMDGPLGVETGTGKEKWGLNTK